MDSKDKVINDLLSRIATLEYEVERLEKENEILKASIKAEEKISNLLPNETDFIIVRKEDYNRLFGSE